MIRPPLTRRVVRHLQEFHLELLLVATVGIVLWLVLHRLLMVAA
jgi:hypothetical protein